MLLCLASSIKAQALIDLETGPVFTGYNDVRIPGDQGTLFSLISREFITDPGILLRQDLQYPPLHH